MSCRDVKPAPIQTTSNLMVSVKTEQMNTQEQLVDAVDRLNSTLRRLVHAYEFSNNLKTSNYIKNTGAKA